MVLLHLHIFFASSFDYVLVSLLRYPDYISLWESLSHSDHLSYQKIELSSWRIEPPGPSPISQRSKLKLRKSAFWKGVHLASVRASSVTEALN